MGRNERLRAARERLPSTRNPERCVSREELAERVGQWISEHDSRGRPHPFYANHLGKLERGTVRRPGSLIRSALCALLDATEAELGFTDNPEDERVTVVGSGRASPDDASIDAVAAVLSRLRRLEDVTSAAEVISPVRTQLALTQRFAATATGGTRGRAVALLSEIEQYLGWLAIPLQQWGDSRAHLDRAATLAMDADDPIRLSMALSFASYRSLLRNDVNGALALNQAAARTEATQGHRTYMALQHAELLAHNKQRIDATQALLTADEELERLVDSTDEPDNAGYWYTPEVLLGHRGFVLDALGDHAAARTAATDALATMPSEWASAEWAAHQRALANSGE